MITCATRQRGLGVAPQTQVSELGKNHMCQITPFRAVRYAASENDRDISTRLAPPYDVLSDDDKRELLARDAANFVKIDLPHTPPKDAGPAEVYEEARRQLEAWLADGTMVRDDQPAIYVYHQRFSAGGLEYTRKMFFARLRIEPFGTGSVFPHERTFGGPKEDRLALTKATRANLSPIFGLYEDSENTVAARLEVAIAEPLLTGRLDDTENTVWAVNDPAVIEDVVQMMSAKAMYIADGHHRYGTAQLYRDWLTVQQGELPEEHPANFVLCVFCAMEDPGLLILPTHRVLPGVAVNAATFKHDDRTEIAHLLIDRPEDASDALVKFGPQALAMWNAEDKSYFMLRPLDPEVLADLEPDRSPAWRKLALAFLHAYLLDRVVTPQVCDGEAPTVHYVKNASAAVDEARETGGTAFLMQATTMEELSAVCSAGDLMPQKSTFFFPKLASGLIVNPLYD
ncbi:MAG: DUF1015 domain-containing protein [Planctomycetota bacterium]|nr:MAG: DUF1015 domain-containing protein [Planctomycetota bacterium]